jgi:LAO/AO transport system kinase
VQSLKAGIMEIADIFVLNKSDREGADRLEKEVRAMQSLASKHTDWIPPIVRTIASTGEGIVELAVAMNNFKQWLEKEGRFEARRQSFWADRMREMIQYQLLRELDSRGFSENSFSEVAARIHAGKENPYRLVPRLVSEVLGQEVSHAARIAKK